MVVVIVCYFAFPTLDESAEEAGAEGDYIEQEDQGQGHFANQGKPSLDHDLLSYYFSCISLSCKLHNCWYYSHSGIFGESIGKSQVWVNIVVRIPVHPCSALTARLKVKHG